MSKPKRLGISEITADPELQSRESLHREAVEDYAEVYRAGNPDSLPAVVTFFDGQTHWLADGFHRFEAIKLAGLKNIPADVRQGDRRDALLFAAGANNSHGLRRSSADKRRAVSMLLADAEWASKSDRWIAEACNVSHVFVGRVRAESTGNVSSSRTGKDGKTRSIPKQHATLEAAEPAIRESIQLSLRALRAIRDERLYRDTHESFELYCSLQWGLQWDPADVDNERRLMELGMNRFLETFN